MGLAYDYLIKGIIDDNIKEDGGVECYEQIPATFAWTVAIVCSMLYYWIFRRLVGSIKIQIPKANQPRLYQKVFAWVSLATYLIQFYYKLSTRKGMFMLNPCHTNVLIMSYLALKPTTRSTKIIYLCWETWLFGPMLSLVFPHLAGLGNQLEVFVYYLEHILIIPVGVVLLQFRYGLQLPTLRDQFLGFATVTLYQYVLLMPTSRLSMANLNFTLCHSHADPAYDAFGYHYFLLGCFYLNFFSYIIRLILYPGRALISFMLRVKQKPE